MQIDGSITRESPELFEVKEILVDVPGGEAQMIADLLERIAAGVADQAHFDDMENLIVVYGIENEEQGAQAD